MGVPIFKKSCKLCNTKDAKNIYWIFKKSFGQVFVVYTTVEHSRLYLAQVWI